MIEMYMYIYIYFSRGIILLYEFQLHSNIILYSINELINYSCIKEVCNIQFNKNTDAILYTYIYIYIFQNYRMSHS